MTRRTRAVLTGGLALAILAAISAAGETPLAGKYRSWLDEDVVYIITSTEREVFLKLTTDRERDLFIEAFWKHRDPTPDSPKNEFKDEHERRVATANRSLGTESPRPGWRTDRGRIYIILGEPDGVERFQGKREIVNCEAWYYQGRETAGLPAAFNLLFFQKDGVGEYKLYSPASDGPMALLAGYTDTGTNDLDAFQALRNVDATLASISLSLIPGDSDPALSRPSLVSDMMIQRIEAVPQRQVEDAYARRFLDYKDRVDVEYTANYLDSAASVHVLQGPLGTAFVHYGVELKRLSVRQTGDTVATTLLLNGIVSTGQGRRVYQFDKSVAVEMSQAEMTERRSLPLDLRDMFPLVPGEYRFSVLVKNEVSKEFTSVDVPLVVPAPGPAARLSALILGHGLQPLQAGPPRLAPFLLAGSQVLSQPERIFLPGDTLYVAFQLLGAGKDEPQIGSLRFEFTKDGEPFREVVRRTAELAALPDVIEPVPLSGFPPAHYRLRVSFQTDGREKAAVTDEFDVTPRDALPRPWYSSKVLPGAGDPVHGRIIGRQLLNLGRFAEAGAVLEPIFARSPDEALAVELARVRMALNEFDRVEEVLGPYLAAGASPKYETLVLAGRAHQNAGRPDRAIELYGTAMTKYGVNVIVLNAVGECHLAAGRRREAQAAWERSLTLSPDQPALRQRLEALKAGRDS